jgi:hypothetical protein
MASPGLEEELPELVRQVIGYLIFFVTVFRLPLYIFCSAGLV